MINSLNITEKEFPDTFNNLNKLVEKLMSITTAAPSGRKLAAEILNEACEIKIKELDIQVANDTPSIEGVNYTNRCASCQEGK